MLSHPERHKYLNTPEYKQRFQAAIANMKLDAGKIHFDFRSWLDAAMANVPMCALTTKDKQAISVDFYNELITLPTNDMCIRHLQTAANLILSSTPKDFNVSLQQYSNIVSETIKLTNAINEAVAPVAEWIIDELITEEQDRLRPTKAINKETSQPLYPTEQVTNQSAN